MIRFAIIELEDGLAVATVQPGQSLEEAAVSQGGKLADPEPYATYEDAYDALCELEDELAGEDREKREKP
jgi:hypothetical protein